MAITNVKAVFDGMPGAFNASAAAGLDVVIQYNITGEGGGEWYVEIKNGTCHVAQGTFASPKTQ